jgi:hypothetical protein
LLGGTSFSSLEGSGERSLQENGDGDTQTA